MPTPAGNPKTISGLYDLFSDFNPYPVRSVDLRDMVATIGTRGRLNTAQATGDNGRQLDHTAGFVRCDATGGPYAMNLPDAPSMEGMHLVLKRVPTDVSANAITFNGINGQNIDGAANVVLPTPPSSVIRLYSDGNNWEAF
jgi:hypothetical protein